MIEDKSTLHLSKKIDGSDEAIAKKGRVFITG